MDDITVSGMPGARESTAIVRPVAAGNTSTHADDELLARLLITSWTLATGRTLRAGIPPEMLSKDELISFWADDQADDHADAGSAVPAAGR
jgi:hypothetical protein